MINILLGIVLLTGILDAHVTLVQFDGEDSDTTFRWQLLNDPVMGGVSKSTYEVSASSQSLSWNGEVKIVPSLSAPGFCNLNTMPSFARFNDATGTTHMEIMARSTVDYTGFKVSFAANTLDPLFNNFKADYTMESTGNWEWIAIPLNQFSNEWDAATGEPTTKCSDNPKVCPKDSDLVAIQQVGIWMEGVAGKFGYEVKWIGMGDGQEPPNLRTQLGISQDPKQTDDDSVTLITFDGKDSKTTFDWSLVNDPVMGGVSVSNYSVAEADSKLVWSGEVKVVPSLQAPGFCNLETTPSFREFNDATGATHMEIFARSTQPYTGFKLSFAANTLIPQFKCFKADYTMVSNGDWEWIAIPLNQFSNEWDAATGEPTTKCSDNPKVCPTNRDLSSIQQVGLWMEGVAGEFDFEIKWVGMGNGNEPPTLRQQLGLEQTSKANDDSVTLITFDGRDSSTTFQWKLTNDPVMGGESESTFSIAETYSKVVWSGEVKIVPSLRAPGFCNLETTPPFQKFNDATGATHMEMLARSTKDYTGFKLSFAANTLNPQFNCFKADYTMQSRGDWEWIAIPLNEFSSEWSPATGEPTTKCSDDASVCPTDRDLVAIQQVGLWMEGVAGEFDFDVTWIGMGNGVEPTGLRKQLGLTNPSMSKLFLTNTKKTLGVISDTYLLQKEREETRSCSNPIQYPLRWGLEKIPGLGDETMAEAICCDTQWAPYAEPQYLYQQVNMFDTLSTDGVNTFYDPTCGIPLFKAPVGRSFEDWKSETDEHGWPSFRDAEMITNNIVVRDNKVYSTCGTKLGDNLPDETGNRYCLDLVCLAGKEPQQPHP